MNDESQITIAKMKELANKVQNNKLEEFSEELQSVSKFTSLASSYSFRNPSKINQVIVQDLEIVVDGQKQVTNGIFPSLGRPILDSNSIGKMDLLKEVWSDKLTSNSPFYWKSALETLSENSDLFSEIDRIRNYNEMIYFADQKAKVATFLNPILEILEQQTKDEIFKIANEHAETVSAALKSCDTNLFPCNMVFEFSGRASSPPKSFPIFYGTQLPDDFMFIVNENNVMAWYIDKIIRDQNLSEIPLKFKDSSENRKIIQALTMNDLNVDHFLIEDIVFGMRTTNLPQDILEKIIKFEEGTVRYFAMLEKKATIVTFETLEMSRKTIKDYFVTRQGKSFVENYENW
ncbi:MAG: hypothetical protein D6732_19145 [Methanobacteriota archaeon]|nr:MAG: hypothetical protein D6732_19145 [Euryarchaeota archaeon]